MRSDRLFSARWIPLSTLLLAVRLFWVPAHLALEHFCSTLAHGAAEHAAAPEHAGGTHAGPRPNPEHRHEHRPNHEHRHQGNHDHQPHTAIDHLTDLIPLRSHADPGPLWAPVPGPAARLAPHALARWLPRPGQAPPQSSRPGPLRARAPPAR